MAEGLRGARRAVLDTMVLIYYFEDSPVYGERCEGVLRSAADGLFEGLITPITAAELLVKPVGAGRHDLADQYRLAMSSLPNVSLTSVGFEAGCMAGALRAKYGLRLPDMLQVAAALEHGSCAVVTNDRALTRVTELPVVLLDELGDGAPGLPFTPAQGGEVRPTRPSGCLVPAEGGVSKAQDSGGPADLPPGPVPRSGPLDP